MYLANLCQNISPSFYNKQRNKLKHAQNQQQQQQ